MASTIEPRVTLRPSEFCQRYGVSRYWVDQRIKDGTLRATRIGAALFIDAAHAERLFLGTNVATPNTDPSA